MKPKLLYIAHRVPFPPNRGDRIRAFHSIQFLSRHADVYLACLNEEPLGSEVLPALHEMCADVAIEPVRATRWVSGASSLITGKSITEGLFYSRRLHQVIQQWSQAIQFDAIVGFCSSMYPYVEAARQTDIPVVVDLVDVDSQKWQDYATNSRGFKRWLFQLESRRIQKLERRLSSQVDAVTLVSHEEANLFRKIAPDDHVLDVTNGVDLEYFTPAPQESPSEKALVFVGVLDYRPNVDGLRWFCDEVWPLVLREAPDAQFRIVGRRPSGPVRQLENRPNVQLIGEVPDIRTHVHDASIVIAPLQIARGVQNKVLEAMAMGKPVVATPQALEGLSVDPELDVVMASQPVDWAQAILRLLNDKNIRHQLATRGRAYVESHHSWAACLTNFLPSLKISSAPDLVSNAKI